MKSELLERYSRNIMLREIGGQGQKRLLKARVLVIGVGGLGNSALMYLTTSGVGTIGIIDHDAISLSNLQRQVLFGVEDIGKLKVDVAKLALNSLNPDIEIVSYPHALTTKNADEIFNNYDLIMDGTDNFSTRYLTNKYCFKKKKPLLFGAISQWDGQVSLYHPQEVSPCFECLFPESDKLEFGENCSQNGVFGPLVGIVGTLMAAEAIKFIVGSGSSLTNHIILYDSLSGQMRRYKTEVRPNCKVCGVD